jgi:hypothetical protein
LDVGGIEVQDIMAPRRQGSAQLHLRGMAQIVVDDDAHDRRCCSTRDDVFNGSIVDAQNYRRRQNGGSPTDTGDVTCSSTHQNMIPKMPAPDLIRGGNRFSEKFMFKQKARV